MKPSKKLLTLSLLTLAMSACSIPKAPETVLAKPNLPLNQPYDVANDVGTPSAEHLPSLAATRWQDFYSDEKLKTLITIGLENSKNLQQLEIALKQLATQYQLKDRNALPLPYGNASANRTFSGSTTGNPNVNDSYSVIFGMSDFELDFWGKVANQKAADLHSYLAQSANKDLAQIRLISDIAKGYAAISYAKAQIILAESTLKSREHSLFIAQKRFEAGVDSKSPVLHATSSLEAAQLALMNANTNLIKQKSNLQLLIGVPIPDELMPEPALTTLISPTLLSVGLPSELLFYRPDIIAAEHELKRAGANINVARAEFFPSVKLSLGQFGFGAKTLSDLFKDGSFGWSSLGPSINIPIFDTGTRRANYNVSQLAQQSALANYEATIQTAFKDVYDILTERRTLDERLAQQYRLQAISQESYNIAFATYRAGLSDYLSVLEAERSLFGAQESILAIELERLTSQIDLYRALGGGATLTATQITHADTQATAMTSARLATADEVATLSGESTNSQTPTPTNQHTPSQNTQGQSTSSTQTQDNTEQTSDK